MDTIIHKQLNSNEHVAQASGLFPGSSGMGTGGTPALQTRQRWLTIATSAVDRAGDILILEGMDATNFLKNPQFLWQHGASGETISTIGKVLDLRVGRASSPDTPSANGTGRAGGTDLRALVEYASPEVSPLAEKVYQMDSAGLLPANSIGFRPIEYEANDFGGYTFTQWELIECSKVELPMNPDAVDGNKSLTTEDTIDWLLQ
jgi:hypothetical protein